MLYKTIYITFFIRVSNFSTQRNALPYCTIACDVG